MAIFDTTAPAAPPALVELGGPAGRIAVSPDNRRMFVTVPSLKRLVVLE